MKFIRVFLLVLFFMPALSHAASNEFVAAAQLLAAAKNADIQQVQALINNGANVNYVDSTGLSVVCTALMNNDVRAAQILQMYGADASGCDRQIKKYKTRNQPVDSGGLFGGLSSAQSITLTAAGAAVIVGGLYFVADWLNPGNDNDNSSSSGGSHGTGGSSTNSGTEWDVSALPYGPAMPNANSENLNYQTNLDYYSAESPNSILVKDFNWMNDFSSNLLNYNYMVLMRGYSPLARGYMGQRTLRNPETNAPILLNKAQYGTDEIGGGRPLNVALVTNNGINAAANTSLNNRFIIWTTRDSNTTAGQPNQSTVSSKYYNNLFTFESVGQYSATEDETLLDKFDLSNSGTAIHNAGALSEDNILGKIVGGNTEGYTNVGDFIGFMPNGQMTIYRTGGGMVMADISPVNAGTSEADDTIEDGDTVELFGKTLTATVSGNAVTLVENESSMYKGYLGVDGLLYMDSDVLTSNNSAFSVDSGYEISGGIITQIKELQTASYLNYAALYDAVINRTTDESNGGRSRVDIIVNADVIEPLHQKDALIVDDVLEGASTYDEYQDNIKNFVVSAYSNGAPDDQIGIDANNFFRSVGNALAVFSTGASVQTTGSACADSPMAATFENAAPLAYLNLNHSFMSVVAVEADTTGSQISKNSDTNVNIYKLSTWGNTQGTLDTSDDVYYKSRICGIAGTKNGDTDPWCFASVGHTDEMAVASAAGAAGVLRSAFYYMTPQQIFTLLALTADGPYLSRLSSGETLINTNSNQNNNQTLISHLQEMYEMPSIYQTKINSGQMAYLDAFKEVFGYGVINLERATTPGTNVYYRSGTNIVSTSGNAYWRAASNTAVHASAALPIRAATVTTGAYDILQSYDGSMSLPRIWETSVSLGNSGRHALYMGDVLGELKTTRHDDANDIKIGNMSFHMARSERAYVDNMNGLDELRLSFNTGAFHVAADYQHYLTDGASRFSGLSNPILGLASNAVTTNVGYDFGNWTFGTRAFTGAITSDGLLENDPTLSAEFMPATLGMINGVGSSVAWHNGKFGATTTFGFVHETDTVLGAQTDGLVGLGAGDTQYIDTELRYSPVENVMLKMRGTYAYTDTSANGLMIADVSAIESNAFAFGADIGNFSFAIARPLAAYSGAMKYEYTNYDITENENGTYGIEVRDAGIKNLRFGSSTRELRLSGEYRHSFGTFTDGALGFIYRVNPNNTDEFGNESIFMLKITHRMGI